MAAIGITWTQIKDLATTRNLPFTHFIENNHYFIFISDGQLSFETRIRIDTPSSSDQTDWVTNFLPSSNILPLDIGGTTLLRKLHDEVVITYRTGAPGNGEIDTIVTKLATVTQDTLTFTYEAGNKLINVVKT